MKRKLADSSEWKRLLKTRYKQTFITNEHYEGYLGIVYIDEVTEPLMGTLNGGNHCLADKGFKWTKFIPKDSNHAIMGIYDCDDNLIEWYFDIIKESGINEEGKVYFDDLYLDIVVFPSGEIYLLDEDELEEALEDGTISKEDYDLAYREVRRLIKEIERNDNYVINNGEEYFEYVKSL